MKIAFISAGLGSLESNIQDRHVKQNIEIDMFYFDSNNFKQRDVIHPRLQAKIPRMFGWEMIPHYDYYIWMDACITMNSPDTVQWLLMNLADNDIALMKHPEGRTSILQELEHMESHMAGNEEFNSGKEYLNERYKNEPMREQVERYLDDDFFVDENLWATGVIIYRNNQKVRNMLKEWYLHNALYSIQDQLSFPYIVRCTRCKVSTIDENIFNNPYTKRWRNVL